MIKNRLLNSIFYMLILTCSLWGKACFADTINDAVVTYNGDCKLSEEDREEFKRIGQEKLTEAKDSLNAMVNGGSIDGIGAVQGLKKSYEAEGGVCHHLHGSAETTWTTEMKMSSSAENGAKLVGNGCEEKLAFINNSDNKYFTDYNIAAIRKKAAKAQGEAQKISTWASSAKEGEFFELDTDLEKTIENFVGIKTDSLGRDNDCVYIVKGSGNSFFCYDPVGSISKKADGTAVVNSDYKGVSFSSPEDFNNKAEKKAGECTDEMMKLEQIREKFAKAHKEANDALDMVSVMNGTSFGVTVSCNCERDGDKFTGKVSSCEVIDSSYKEDDVDEGCKPIATYAQELSSNCIICGLFATILGAVQKISQQAFDATVEGLTALLGVAFLLYIAYTTLLAIASPEAQKLSKYLGELVAQGFKVAVTILILQHPTFLYQEMLTPILDGGIDFGLSLSSVDKAGAQELGSKYADKFNMNSDYLPGAILMDLTGTVHSFQNVAAEMPGMGRALMCFSFEDLPWDPNMKFIPRFTMLINGILLYVFGLGIMLAVGFYMLDCALSLGMVCALMAFFVASWPFKLTVGYTKTGWNMFLNVFFNFVMMGVIVKTIVELSAQAVSGGSKERLTQLMAEGDAEALDAELGMGGEQIILVIVCCLLCFKLPKESGRLANKFAGGAQIQMGADMGGMATSAATGAAKGGVKLAGKAAGGMAKSAAEHSGAKAAINKAGGAIKNVANKALSKVGIGKNAKMGSKGRDKGANNNREANFK